LTFGKFDLSDEFEVLGWVIYFANVVSRIFSVFDSQNIEECSICNEWAAFKRPTRLVFFGPLQLPVILG
jgi:hypothetical protein